MAPKWTSEQLAAIKARDCSLLVSAAAGAGKTAVLVERIIKRITDPQKPIDVDKMLIVTFTKAAASEMRERIGLALARELNEGADSGHLNRQAILLNRASITTLHSFCLEVVRKYFYRLDLDPAFRVGDDTETFLLQLEAVEELFEEKYDKADEGFLALVDAYGGDRDDSRLQEIILGLYRFAISNPWPQQWLNGLEDSYIMVQAQPIEGQPWARSLLSWIQLQLHGCVAKLKHALKLAAGPGGPNSYETNLQQDLILVDELLQASDTWERLYQKLGQAEFTKLKTCRDKYVDDLIKERVKKLRESVKKCVKALADEFFLRPVQDCVEDLRRVKPHIGMIARLVGEFMKKYTELKTTKGLVDFADLEHYCLRVLLDDKGEPGKLIPSSAALELQSYFEEVLVDEYQDINAVQETVLNLVSRQLDSNEQTPNMFMVGDVKQSIYRFRLAEPSLFLGKYTSYPRDEKQTYRAIDLTKNFRSRSEVINAVNYIFRQLMTPRVGEILYDEKAELVCGAEYLSGDLGGTPLGGAVELHLLEKNLDLAKDNRDEAQHIKSRGSVNSRQDEPSVDNDQSEELEELAELDALQREARLVGRRILELVSSTNQSPGSRLMVHDKTLGDYRPVSFRDIVILMRATRGAANVFMEELKGVGIPVYADLDTGYFAAIEVETMMCLLKVIDNPRQDIPLAAVLRSPIVGLKSGELAVIRLQAPKERSFFEAVKAAVAVDAELDPDIKDKLGKFLFQLDKWRTLARQEPLSRLIWRLYNETGYFVFVGVMPGGGQRQANLRALYDRARQYESTSYRGLFRFLRFMERFQDIGSDLGTARSLGEKEDVVRVMSIHKSKGLEFPVVIVAGLGKQFNTNDLRQDILLHKEIGVGIPVVDAELRVTYPSLVQSAIKRKIQAELLAEEMRVLYVALTRAREKLILVGSVKDLSQTATKWCLNLLHEDWPLPDADLSAAKTFLDWICPAVARHNQGEALRKLACCEDLPIGCPAEDQSLWEVHLWSAQDCSAKNLEQIEDYTELLEKVRRLEPAEITGGEKAELERRLDWSYPFNWAVGKPTKVAVTEVKRRFAQLEAEETEVAYTKIHRANFTSPLFIQEKRGLTPAERGSVMHLVMQHLDFHGELSLEGLAAQVRKMQVADLLTAEQAQVVDYEALHIFFASELGRRCLVADEIFREVPFTLALEAGQIYPDMPGENSEKVLVQGVIDCLLREGQAYILIDYKTDRIPRNDTGLPDRGAVEKLVNAYSGQMNIYAKAIETILGLPVREKILYFFSVGTAVNID